MNLNKNNYLLEQYEANDKLPINHNYLREQFRESEEIFLDIKKLIQRSDYTLGKAVDEIKLNSSNNQVQYSCKKLHSGIYFYSIKTVNGISKGNKLIILK